MRNDTKFAAKRPKVCLACRRAKVTFPAIICRNCVDTDCGREAVAKFRRSAIKPRAAHKGGKGGSVRTVAGGLPSLGKSR
jgi:hypothetical protein